MKVVNEILRKVAAIVLLQPSLRRRQGGPNWDVEKTEHEPSARLPATEAIQPPSHSMLLL